MYRINYKRRCATSLVLAMFLLTACSGGGGGGGIGGGGGSNAVAPTFSQQPASVSAVVGQSVSFSATANGTAPLTYQWMRNGINIDGATGTTYSLAAALADSGARFSVRVSNAAGSVTSDEAILAVPIVLLPQSGQTWCYDTSSPPQPVACTTAGISPGQDGSYQKGVASPSPRFVVDGTNACVTDSLTGLMWSQNDHSARSWQNALDYVNALDFCGYTDWRLPNRQELESLVNYNEGDSASWLNGTGFINVQANWYWSSSSYRGSSAWIVNMSDGRVSANVKTNGAWVLPVRAGQ